MKEDGQAYDEYRDSHASPDYGKLYARTYEVGYYRDQWERIEKPLLQSILGDLQKSGRDECLDFACGTGRIAAVAAGCFSTVVGVDVSATMLQQAKHNCDTVEFIQQDITSVPLDRSFDVVTAFRFFLNAQSELRTSALESIHRCLRENGRLVLNIHVNSTSILGIAYRLRNRLAGKTVANTCSFAAIEQYLKDCGFEVETTAWYSYLPRIGWRFSRLSGFLMMPLERFSRWFPLVPKGLAQSFIIVARKV